MLRLYSLKPEANFTISAKVTGKLKAVYDVAALVVYQDDETWAKFLLRELCQSYADQLYLL